ncbi:MAG: serine/threonine protein kinase, partial [Gammaproteobacteria bacterium]
AGGILKTALTEESDHPEIKRLRSVLESKVKAAKKTYKQYQLALRNNEVDQSKVLIARTLKIWRDNTEYVSAFKSIKIGLVASKAICQERLAGFGKRSRGRCYDMLTPKDKGPIMVVLPAGAGHSSSFAISKYEISVGDFNQYCKQTGKCKTSIKNPKLPITGITFQQAQDYAAWISKKTGAKYRIPTDKEWLYAANANGKGIKGKNYNCTLRLGEKLMKGTGLEDVDSGAQNGWGLANYVGNAQEWVEAPSGLKAKGGAYTDTMEKCSVKLERTHNGNPDKLTTFRLVRDVT